MVSYQIDLCSTFCREWGWRNNEVKKSTALEQREPCIIKDVCYSTFYPSYVAHNSRSWLGKISVCELEEEIQEIKRRISAMASEQLTPELSQGALVARHVDGPWQVALVHVAQLELLLHFTFPERQRQSSREKQKVKREETAVQNNTTALSGWLSVAGSFLSNNCVPVGCVAESCLQKYCLQTKGKILFTQLEWNSLEVNLLSL